MGEILPLVVAIVFGLIYNFSKMMKQNQNQGSEKSKPVIPPKLDPMHPNHFGEHKPKKSQIQPASDQPVKELGVNRPFTSGYSPTKEKVVEQRVQVKKKINDESPVKIQNLTKQKLVEGVVMAEILGAPRALKPHHSSRSPRLSK
jgi:hypothetical protein